MQLSIGSFYPNLLLSGILWPLEGMPLALQYIAKFLPNTLACQVNNELLFLSLIISQLCLIYQHIGGNFQAMRDIMLRGWGIDRPEVLLFYLNGISSKIIPRFILV